MTTVVKVPPVSVPTRLSFGIGSVSDSIHSISFNLFCFFYYTQVLGVPGSLVGLVAGLAIIVDAISDPAVGMLSDRLHTRLGRRHPLMLAASIPLGFCFAALFSPPSGLSSIQLAFWMFTFASGTRIALTFFSVPHLAFGAELDPDHIGRTKTMSWHAIFLWVGGASCHFLGLAFFFDGPRAEGSGMLRVESYPIYGMVWGSVIAIAVLASALLTLHRVRYLITPEQDGNQKIRDLIQDFSEVFTNRNFVWLVVGLILFAATSGMHDALGSHLALYYFEFTTGQYKYYGIAAMFGYFLGFALTTSLHKTLGKPKLLAISALSCAIASSAAVWLRLLGLFPENDSALTFPLVLFFVFLFYNQQSILIISVMSLLGDIADEHYLLKGRRREGVFYSARSFFGKASSALGHMLAGIILDVTNFPLGADVIPGTVDSDIIYDLGFNYGVVATIPGMLAGAVYLQCKMTAARHREVMRLLQERDDN